MGKFIRIEDTRTGHEYTIDEDAFDSTVMKRSRNVAEADGVVVPPTYADPEPTDLDAQVPDVTTTKTGKSA